MVTKTIKTLKEAPKGNAISRYRDSLRRMAIKAICDALASEYCNRIEIKDPNGVFKIDMYDNFVISEINLNGVAGRFKDHSVFLPHPWSSLSTDNIVLISEWIYDV